jgi:hypothetical protein
MPDEWLEELSGLNPESHEHKEILKVFAELATQGCVVLEPMAPRTEVSDRPPLEVPRGFSDACYLAEPAIIQASEVEQKVHSLDVKTDIIRVPIIELTSDTGRKVRVCDLRDMMKRSVVRLGPSSQVERDRLDDAFLMDVKHIADQGRPRNTVRGARGGIGYAKVPRSKLRGYFTMVHDASSDDGRIPTVARLADCGNFDSEQVLYSLVFAKKLEK